MKIHFFAPSDPSDYPEFGDRSDHRVTVLDHDEVSQTSRVVFSDDFRGLVRDCDLVSREA